MDDQGHDTPTLVEPSASPQLEITGGEDIGQTFAVKRRTRIGRERDNDIVLLDPKVSRYHALISLEASQWTLNDLGSSNHTYLNGQLVSTPTNLHSGDRVNIGETELTFRIPGVPLAETSPVQATPVPAGAPTEVDAAVATAPPVRASMPAETITTERTSPPRLAWIAGGFVLLLCLATVVVIYLLSRTSPGQEPGTAAAFTPVTAENGGVGQPVEMVEPPDNLVLIYEDDFSDSFGGWDDAFDAYTTKQYGNNRYQIEINTDNLIAWGLANRKIADFELEVEVRQEDGAKSNSYGLLFRVKDRDKFYRFDISGDGFFLVSKFLDGQWYNLVDWTPSPDINPDTNILKVSAFGSKITVWANGQPLASVTDDSFSDGNFGFFASTFGEPYMWVSFDNLKVWVPEGQQITMLPTATISRVTPVPPSTATATASPTSTPSPTSPSSPLSTPTSEAVEASPTPTPTPSPEPTATPIPLPEYASRDQPLARGEERVTGRIVFPLFNVERGTYDIYLANAADGNNRTLVQQNASQPGLNQDGTEIAYRSWQPDNRGLFARPLAGGEAWHFEIFFESARPQYSPADNSLMYHSRTGGKEPAVYRVINGVGQVMRRDGGPIQGRNAKWSPDGQKFVYSSCLGSTCGIILSNIDGAYPVTLTDHPSDTAPEISPNGSTVVFMSQRSGDWEIYSVSINGGEITALTADDASDGLPTWSPDGNKIAFVANRDGEWAMWDMDSDGSSERRLFVLGGSIDGVVQHDVANSFGWVEENIDWIP
ncbi:MAG: FHA domain-containing protein [Anaerolineae bacterium]|nr:FHA domain-containing protein [Anaerolineae bacterium]